MKKLPDTIYVVYQNDQHAKDEPYLVASEDTDMFSDGEVVGTYKRIGTGKKRVTHTLIPKGGR